LTLAFARDRLGFSMSLYYDNNNSPYQEIPLYLHVKRSAGGRESCRRFVCGASGGAANLTRPTRPLV
jgi:hypothetical protein